MQGRSEGETGAREDEAAYPAVKATLWRRNSRKFACDAVINIRGYECLS